MNEITKKQTETAPVKITDDIQISLNRLGRELETHAESGIRIGNELICLKEITPHGKFGNLVEWAYGLKSSMCQNYMNVARQFGQKPTRVGFSNKVLVELSRPSVPESAREEAKEHEALTVKQAKDLVSAHKELAKLQERLDEKITPNIDNLIPGLKAIHSGGSITRRLALIYSQLSEQDQDDILSIEKTKAFKAKEIAILKAEKLELTESANKAHEKANAMQGYP